MVLYLVHDRKRTHVVMIECYPPTAERPFWLPMSPELTLLEACAIAMYRPTRMYALAKTLRSCRKRGGKLIFDSVTFVTYDLPRLDEDHTAAFDDEPPKRPKLPPPIPWDAEYLVPPDVRAGRHRRGCPRTETSGPCPVDASPKVRPNDRKPPRRLKWTTRKHGPRRHHTADDPSFTTPDLDNDVTCLPVRPTRTEATLWRLAGGDPDKYADLTMEYSDEIEADREAGRFRSREDVPLNENQSHVPAPWTNEETTS